MLTFKIEMRGQTYTVEVSDVDYIECVYNDNEDITDSLTESEECRIYSCIAEEAGSQAEARMESFLDR